MILEAEPRSTLGKGGARAARRAGKIPGVVFGADKPPEHVALDALELTKAHLRGDLLSTLIELDVSGEKTQVLPREVQTEPVRDTILHIDFLRVTERTRIAVEVPALFVNEEASPGLKRGGVLNIVRREIELLCPAGAIPESLEFDVSGLDIGDAVKISMVALPENVVPTITDRDFTVATIAAPSAVKSAEEEEAEAAAAADEEGAEETAEGTESEGETEDSGGDD